MVPTEPSPILKRLIALYQATMLLERPALFHMEMQGHVQELEKALSPAPAPAAAVPDLPKVEPAP